MIGMPAVPGRKRCCSLRLFTDVPIAPVTGLEPVTRRLTAACSAALSYTGSYTLRGGGRI
jgi:hypothetical protein